MFDWKCLKWITSQNTISSCNECANHNWKLTSNPNLFDFHSGSNFLCHSTGVIRNTNEYHTSLYARYLNINIRDDDIHDSFSWCTFQVHIPPRLKCTFNTKMIRCGTGGVVFIGGHCTPPEELFFENLRGDNIRDTNITDQTIHNHILWHGEISRCGNDMFWNAIDIGISFDRPTGFKLKNSLFIIDSFNVIGDFSRMSSNWKSNNFLNHNFCDKYDLLRKQYHHNVFELPFMYYLSLDEPKIVTDRNETFAMIVVREVTQNFKKERVWIFTESDGFKEMTDLESFFSTYRRDNGLLIRIR